MGAEQTAHLIGILLGALFVGALCGLLPLFVGLKRQKTGLAVAGLISCVIGGFILGIILALPVAIVFTVIILCTKPPAPPEPPVAE